MHLINITVGTHEVHGTLHQTGHPLQLLQALLLLLLCRRNRCFYPLHLARARAYAGGRTRDGRGGG